MELPAQANLRVTSTQEHAYQLGSGHRKLTLASQSSPPTACTREMSSVSGDHRNFHSHLVTCLPWYHTGFPDPFAVATIGGEQTRTTGVIKKTLNPYWNESFDMYVTDLGYMGW